MGILSHEKTFHYFMFDLFSLYHVLLVSQGIWGKREGIGVLQQGRCRSQPVEGRCGEAEDELKHQEAAGDDCEAFRF